MSFISANKPVCIKNEDCTIDNSDCERLLVVKVDVNLNFNNHISEASRKISALARVTLFMRLSKRKSLFKVFFHVTVQLLPTHLVVR